MLVRDIAPELIDLFLGSDGSGRDVHSLRSGYHYLSGCGRYLL